MPSAASALAPEGPVEGKRATRLSLDPERPQPNPAESLRPVAVPSNPSPTKSRSCQSATAPGAVTRRERRSLAGKDVLLCQVDEVLFQTLPLLVRGNAVFAFESVCDGVRRVLDFIVGDEINHS